MSTYIKDEANGCTIKYRQAPLELPDGETVYFEIEGIEIPEGADKEDMVELLKKLENDLNTEVLKITGQQASGVYPHFYVRCPYPEKADIIVSTFLMTYVDSMRILVQPAIGELGFIGSKDEYLRMKKDRDDEVLVVNAKNTTANESMIQYWVDHTYFEFGYSPYLCPATGEVLGRGGLDGAHVEIVGHPEMGQFITPVKKAFNESHSRRSFYVKPEYLVEAPNKE